MNNNPENLFELAESRETPAPSQRKDSVDDLFEKCAQCDIGGGTCPTHRRRSVSHPVHDTLDYASRTHNPDWRSHGRVADREALILKAENDADRPLSPDEISEEIKRWKERLS